MLKPAGHHAVVVSAARISRGAEPCCGNSVLFTLNTSLSTWVRAGQF